MVPFCFYVLFKSRIPIPQGQWCFPLPSVKRFSDLRSFSFSCTESCTMFVLSLFAFFSISLQYFQEQRKIYFLSEKWQGRRQGMQGKTNASSKLLKPRYKSFQTYHGNRLTQVHSVSYLYWYCTCAPTHGYPCLQHVKKIYTANEWKLSHNRSIHSRLRDSCEMGCYCNTNELLQLSSLSHHHLLC